MYKLNRSGNINNIEKKNSKKKKILIGAGAIILILGIVFTWKANSVANKISTNSGIFQSLIKAVPGVKDEVRGEEDGRINILVLGMRGENVAGGGLLADTIMVVSVKPGENKASMISVPRDFYVDNPALGTKSKINAVYAYAERDGKKEGIETMKKVISEVTGLPIHYGVVINFKGFSDLVDSLGGVEITLEKPFYEPLQFNEAHVCDPNVFTIPTGEFEVKKNEKGKIVAQYPLCTNPDVECGGEFKLPAGTQTLDGENALCYVRSRKTSSDFDRARRQQDIVEKIKEKALSLGTLTSFEKVNGIIDSLGNNSKTDMQLWEMKRMFEIYSEMENPVIYQRVLENSEEGLLYAPESTPETGYILLPRGDNYNKIHELFANIFVMSTEPSDTPEQTPESTESLDTNKDGSSS